MFCTERKNGFRPGLKAQFTVVALVMVFIMLLMFAKFYPIMEEYIEDLVGEVDELTATLIALIPFLIAAAIIMSITWYIIPKRQ